MARRGRSRSKKQEEPRSLLQKARLERGWSQQQVVDRLQTICPGHRDHESCRLDVAKLSDYERQARRPSVIHIEALARVYNQSPETLGLIIWRDTSDDEEKPEDPSPEPPLAYLVIPVGPNGSAAEALRAVLDAIGGSAEPRCE